MPRAYIFDVDGTLTDSREKIDPEFEMFFLEFIEKHECYIVTGSNYEKTLEQLDYLICHGVKRCYQCSGNSVYQGGAPLRENDWEINSEIREFLEEMLEESPFKKRIGLHIDERPGLVNFSILGRGTESVKEDQEQYFKDRKEYEDFDLINNEREYICKKFNRRFLESGVSAQVAGATGIDIMPVGADKSQILEDFNDMDVYFFGDMMQPGGNDEPLKNAIIKRNNNNDKCYQVDGWKSTWSLLKAMNAS